MTFRQQLTQKDALEEQTVIFFNGPLGRRPDSRHRSGMPPRGCVAAVPLHMHQQQVSAQTAAGSSHFCPRARPETRSSHIIWLRNRVPITSPSLRLPEWLLAHSAFRPRSSASHLSKPSCCITTSGPRHSNSTPGKKQIQKPNLQSPPRHIWEGDGKYKALT